MVFPLFGLHATIGQNIQIGAIFTVVSIARSYALRRLFEHVRVRGRSGTAGAFVRNGPGGPRPFKAL
jgi:hypothetical protein